MKTDYAGIDYSMGKSNRNHETGIHHGIIQANHIGQYWFEESETYYIFHCPQCETELDEDMMCPNCSCEPDADEFDFVEPMSFYINDNELVAEQLADDPDIFIIESKFYTWCQFCSPCAPGAGYLENYTDPHVGIKAYCFGHDWFEDGKAPYPVYSVKTNEEVIP